MVLKVRERTVSEKALPLQRPTLLIEMIFIPISHSRQPKISKPIKHDDDREPHFPAVNIVFVEVTIEPANSKIVRRRHDPCCTDGVICAYVADDSNL